MRKQPKIKTKIHFSKVFDTSLALTILLFFSRDIFAYDTYNSRTGELSVELVQVG